MSATQETLTSDSHTSQVHQHTGETEAQSSASTCPNEQANQQPTGDPCSEELQGKLPDYSGLLAYFRSQTEKWNQFCVWEGGRH